MSILFICMKCWVIRNWNYIFFIQLYKLEKCIIHNETVLDITFSFIKNIFHRKYIDFVLAIFFEKPSK